MKHVTFHLPSFLRRVRIHGGEFDSSARAMNRVKQARLLQAEPRIVRGSTIERKQMSTKTTFKRIALVTVAALGFGVLSVVPSNAVIGADTFALSGSTAAQTTAETLTASSASATLKFLGSIDDSVSVTASLVSGPGAAFPYISLAETASVQIDGANKPVGYVPNPYNTAVRVEAKSASAFATAKFNVYLGTDSLTAPATAGTYVVKLTPASVGLSGALQASTAQTLTITVTAAPADDKVAVTATSIINAGETNSATADVVVTSTRDVDATTPAATKAAATIVVTLKNKSALAAAESFTATIAGPGSLGSATVGSGNDIDDPNPTARILTIKNGDVIQVFPDGTSGVATITIASLLGVELAKETVTFFGAPATIVTTVKKPVLGGTLSVAGVLDIVVKDSAGVAVSNLGANSVRVVSSDVAKIAGAYTAVTPVWSATTQSYTVPLTPVAAGSANITVTTKASAAATTGIDAAAVSVRVGGAAAQLDGVTVATDKTSYAPGELVTLTVTPLDAAGLVLGDETYTVFTSAGIVSSHILTMVTGSLVLAGAHDGGVAGTGTKLGVATYKFYAPNIEGDLKLSWTRSASFATAANDDLTGSLTIAISSPGTAAATDAANEATDAANAATDAALAAAEAADAATSAAQEASDAVAALSESVTKLIAGLQSQIKSLAAVVAKIAKKVKA
jgi:trimeric autotransporter adhesin